MLLGEGDVEVSLVVSEEGEEREGRKEGSWTRKVSSVEGFLGSKEENKDSPQVQIDLSTIVENVDLTCKREQEGITREEEVESVSELEFFLQPTSASFSTKQQVPSRFSSSRPSRNPSLSSSAPLRLQVPTLFIGNTLPLSFFSAA